MSELALQLQIIDIRERSSHMQLWNYDKGNSFSEVKYWKYPKSQRKVSVIVDLQGGKIFFPLSYVDFDIWKL